MSSSPLRVPPDRWSGPADGSRRGRPHAAGHIRIGRWQPSGAPVDRTRGNPIPLDRRGSWERGSPVVVHAIPRIWKLASHREVHA